MRVRRFFAVLSAASVLVCVVIACSSFDADAEGGPDAAPDTAPLVDASALPEGAVVIDAGPERIKCGTGFLAPGSGNAIVDGADTMCGDAGIVKLLNNSQHCGACFHSCGAAGCSSGVCNHGAIIVDADGGAAFLGLRGEHLYWSRPNGASDSSDIRRAQRTGAGREDIFTTNAGEVAFAGLTPTSLFLPQAQGRMTLIPNEAGAGAAIPVGDPGIDVGAITTSGETAYFTDPAAGRVRFARAGGAGVMINGEPHLTAITSDGDALFWLRAAGDIDDAGADDAGPGILTRFNLDGGQLQRAPTRGYPTAVAVDGDYAYVFDATTRELRRFDKRKPIGTGDLLSTWTGAENFVSAMVVDEANVYMLAGAPSSPRALVLRVSKCGGAPLRVMTLTPVPAIGAIAVDETFIYAPEPGRGIRRGPK